MLPPKHERDELHLCSARRSLWVPEVCLARLPVPGPRPGRAVHRGVRRSPGRRGYRGREDPAPKPARMLMRKGSCSRPGRRSPTRCRSSAGDTCGPSWPQYEAYYNGRRPIAAASSTRPGPTTLPPTSPRSGSSADPSSAALSTNTSGPHRSHGQDRWPSSGPQDSTSAVRVRGSVPGAPGLFDPAFLRVVEFAGVA